MDAEQGVEHRLREVAERLYGLEPGDFTAARNAAAQEARAQDRALADRVKGLRRPSLAAWVVNLLVRQDSTEMTGVLDLGEQLRQAQADLDGDALRELARQRRRLVAAVAQSGRRLAGERDVTVSEAVLRQVEETLHAAMLDTDAAAAVRTGLLVDPLSATGIGTLRLATAVAGHTALGAPGDGPVISGSGSVRGSRPGLSAVPDRDPEERRREERRAARAAARDAVRAARADLAAARRHLSSRDQRIAELAARTLQVSSEIEELRRRIDELESGLEGLDEEAEVAQEEREDATETVTLAAQALAAAETALSDLG